ncbi:MAG: C39 family peptidase [Kouleothrix sp.]
MPPRAQLDYPNGPNICSPTALAMVLVYWHARTGDARLAPFAERRAVAELTTPQVYDPLYEGHGNWGFNTAYAGSLGLDAYGALWRHSRIGAVACGRCAGGDQRGSAAGRAGERADRIQPRHPLIVAPELIGLARYCADPLGASARPRCGGFTTPASLSAPGSTTLAGTAYLIHPRGWSVPAL